MEIDTTEYKKELSIIKKYGKILEKYAGYLVVNEKHLLNKKKDIQQAIKMMLVLYVAAKKNCDTFISSYSQLGIFQKSQNISNKDLMDPDPKKFLIKRKKHKIIIDKANSEQDTLYKEINLLIKVLKEEIKKKLHK